MRTEARRALENAAADILEQIIPLFRDGAIHPAHPDHAKSAQLAKIMDRHTYAITDLLEIELEREAAEEEVEGSHG